MTKEHTFEDTLAELRRHSDAKRNEELYENSMVALTEHIREMVTDDQIKAWRIIESLIDGESTKTNPPVNTDHIRHRLMFGREK